MNFPEVRLPLYSYQSNSLLQQVAIRTNESGGMRAYLSARSDASPEQLQAIQSSLDAQGWKSIATMYEGKPALEVRGFKAAEIALSHLHSNGWVDGNPIEAQPLDGDVRTPAQKREHSTLRWAGISYLAGDAGYMYYAVGKRNLGIKKNDGILKEAMSELAETQASVQAISGGAARGLADAALKSEQDKVTQLRRDHKIEKGFDNLDIVAGIGYALGSLALTFYGNRDQSQNSIQSTASKVQRYLRQQDIKIEDDSAIHGIVKEPKRSFFGKIDSMLAKYPSETLNSIYVVVGGALTLVGMYNVFGALKTGNKKALQTELIETGLGFTTAGSAIAGLTIKEKKRAEGEPRKTGLAGVWEWIEEKPLRATGIGYMVATGFHGVGTIRKYRAGDEVIRKTIGGRGLFVVSNVLSEFLLVFSSKGHGTGVKPDASIDQTVLAATADTIMRQPLERQEHLISELASHLSAPDVMGGKTEDIAKQLKEHMETLKSNPWAKKLAQPPVAIAQEAPAEQQITQLHTAKVERKDIAHANENGKAANSDWKEHVAASKGGTQVVASL